MKTKSKKKKEKKFNPNPLNQPTIQVVSTSFGDFIPCSEAQPQFDKLVLVLVTLRGGILTGSQIIGLGKRTKVIDPIIEQEIWSCKHLENLEGYTLAITHWKPL